MDDFFDLTKFLDMYVFDDASYLVMNNFIRYMFDHRINIPIQFKYYEIQESENMRNKQIIDYLQIIKNQKQQEPKKFNDLKLFELI